MKASFLASLLGVACCAGAAHAEAGDAYQFAFVPGSSTFSQNVIRTNTASGKSVLCAGSLTCVAIAEAGAIPAGSYRIEAWNNEVPAHSWGVTRYDAKSGRVWVLLFDGKAASWQEYTAP